MTDICHQLHLWANQRPHFSFPFNSAAIPLNGIYVLFEKGEHAHTGNRIVRVGTHTGKNQLRSRLKQHFLIKNKDRSIFRKNIGRALLAKTNDPFSPHWEIDRTTAKLKSQHANIIDNNRQYEIEENVSAYIQSAFSFIVFEIQSPEERLTLESKLISTVSLCETCTPSSTWLGNHSPKPKIVESGLWLVNELYKTPLLPNDLLALQNCP